MHVSVFVVTLLYSPDFPPDGNAIFFFSCPDQLGIKSLSSIPQNECLTAVLFVVGAVVCTALRIPP